MGEREKNTLIFIDSDNGGIIHVANIKGGVGKSTVATNLAASLSKRGPGLVIDLDVQGSATVALGKDTDPETGTSWDLFRKRVPGPEVHNSKGIRQFTSLVKKQVFQYTPLQHLELDIKKLILTVQPGLDLIPAGSALFKNPSRLQIDTLAYNIQMLRNYYKYIIIDTPSVWNTMTRTLFLHSDLNLIPVTLNALSTKSLKEYLSSVQRLSQRYSGVRIRIIKNEVFGKSDSKLVGKTRTMNENRKYLEQLCEQVTFQSSNGIALLPQSIMFDLEIPESAIVRNAQDEGKPVLIYSQYGAITKSFDELAKKVQYVLNTPVDKKKNFLESTIVTWAGRVAAAVLFFTIFVNNSPISEFKISKPTAPQQLIIPDGGIFSYTFNDRESIYRVAKYAICRFKATVPSPAEIDDYIEEVVSIHNLTRLSDEPRINSTLTIPKGLTLTFYPPQNIKNLQEKQLVNVYRYFSSLVTDSFAYITGDWCERGTGGGQPHYGIDVAANLGEEILSPMEGQAVLSSGDASGRIVGIVKDNMIIFYAHMDKRYIKNGQHVKAGQPVGTIGMTGRTSGPHVHIGYGIRTETASDLVFGNSTYRLTDPKLFFYRKMYLEGIGN